MWLNIVIGEMYFWLKKANVYLIIQIIYIYLLMIIATDLNVSIEAFYTNSNCYSHMLRHHGTQILWYLTDRIY